MTDDDIRDLLDQATDHITDGTLPTGLDWEAIAVTCHQETSNLEPDEAASLGFVAGYLAARPTLTAI